jgi:hypothetical protein
MSENRKGNAANTGADANSSVSPDLVGILIATMIMLGTLGATRELPSGMYFSYSDIVSGTPISVSALLIRFGIPFLVCFGLSWRRNFRESDAIAACLAATLLVVWPSILTPEVLRDDLYSSRFLLYAVYVMFAIAFACFGAAGAKIGQRVRASKSVHDFLSIEVKKRRDTLRDLVIGVVSSGIYAYLEHLWNQAK